MKNLPTLSSLFLSTAFPFCEPVEPNPQSMEWYKKLPIHIRINAKECFKMLCGAEFSGIARLLGLRLTIDVLYNKLKMEGFDV